MLRPIPIVADDGGPRPGVGLPNVNFKHPVMTRGSAPEATVIRPTAIRKATRGLTNAFARAVVARGTVVESPLSLFAEADELPLICNNGRRTPPVRFAGSAPDELALAAASGVQKTKTNIVLFGVQVGSWSIS